MLLSVSVSQVLFFTQATAVSVCGKARIDEAKITGMTPPALTFSGIWVDCPPITRRPITRLAYCTGMRRSPRSTSTMKATTAIIIASMKISVSALHSWVTKTLVVDVRDARAEDRPRYR